MSILVIREVYRLLSKTNNILKLSAIMLALLPMASFAAGFQINETSPRLEGEAMAGSGTDAGDITAIFNNPAILATIPDREAYIGGSYVDPRISMKNASAQHTVFIPNSTTQPVTLPVTGQDSQGSVAPAAFVPNMFISSGTHNSTSIGLAITAPWGLTTQYDDNSVVRYMAQTSQLETVNFSPMISYQLNDKWSLGAGLQVQYAKAKFSNWDGVPAQGQTPPAATNLSGDGWGTGYNLGVLYSPNQNLHLGLSYRSEIDYTLSGYGTEYIIPGGVYPNPPSLPAFPFNGYGNATASLNTPAVLNFSVSAKVAPKWVIDGTEQITFWHSLNGLNIHLSNAYVNNVYIPLNWHDTSLTSVGVQYLYNARWTYRTGVAYDQTPTNNGDRDARIPDANRYWAAMGTTYHVSDRVNVDAAYEHIFMQAQHINLSQTQGTISPDQPYEINTVQADYIGSADVFALGLSVKF
jgi:long-chain fatty acid transport protein